MISKKSDTCPTFYRDFSEGRTYVRLSVFRFPAHLFENSVSCFWFFRPATSEKGFFLFGLRFWDLFKKGGHVSDFFPLGIRSVYIFPTAVLEVGIRSVLFEKGGHVSDFF